MIRNDKFRVDDLVVLTIYQYSTKPSNKASVVRASSRGESYLCRSSEYGVVVNCSNTEHLVVRTPSKTTVVDDSLNCRIRRANVVERIMNGRTFELLKAMSGDSE